MNPKEKTNWQPAPGTPARDATWCWEQLGGSWEGGPPGQGVGWPSAVNAEQRSHPFANWSSMVYSKKEKEKN